MEPEVRERFEKIEAILHKIAEGEKQFNQRHDQAERRHFQAMERMDRADKRMDKFDNQLQKTRQVIELGMRLMVRMEQRQKVTDAKLEALAKSQKAFLDSLRRGSNGSKGTR